VATTGGRLARAALDALASVGVGFVVLHHESAVAHADARGDVDLAVADPPRVILERARAAWSAVDLHPVMVWSYDVGLTVTVFLATGEGRDGVQLDLLHDPDGLGKYGVKSSVLVAAGVPGQRWLMANPDHELLYSIRKRSFKRDRRRLADLLSAARMTPPLRLAAEVPRLFSPRGADLMRSALEGDVDEVMGRSAADPLHEAARRVGRLTRPPGFWVEMTTTATDAAASARKLADRFGGYLPHAAAGHRPASTVKAWAWWLHDVAPVRWRPGLFVSWSSGVDRWPSADLVVTSDGSDIDHLARRIVTAAEGRIER
jgi:hypothetical protein